MNQANRARSPLLLGLLCAPLIVVGCSSSASGPAAPSCDAGCSYVESLSAPAGSFDATNDPGPPSVAASNIVDNYDTATCGDWAVTDEQNRQIVATYFLVEASDPSLNGLEVALQTAITTACANVDPGVTVARVAQLSIASLQGGG